MGLGLSLIVMLTGSYFFLFSHKWSLYLYSLSNKGNRAHFVGEFSTEDACLRKARAKVSERIQLDRDVVATDFMCGRHCLEFPVLELNISSIHCLVIRSGYNGERLRR